MYTYILPTLLFVILSPGMLLTLPAGSKGLFASGQTSMKAIAVHAAVFALALVALRYAGVKIAGDRVEIGLGQD